MGINPIYHKYIRLFMFHILQGEVSSKVDVGVSKIKTFGSIYF